MAWKRRNRYVLERSDGARVCACKVGELWRFGAFPAGEPWRAVGYFDWADDAKHALDATLINGRAADRES